MSPSLFVLALALMAGCGNQAAGASKADYIKPLHKNILAPFGSPDCSLCGECNGVCINDMANLSNSTFEYVASVGRWVLGEVSTLLPFPEFGTVCVPSEVVNLVSKYLFPD